MSFEKQHWVYCTWHFVGTKLCSTTQSIHTPSGWCLLQYSHPTYSDDKITTNPSGMCPITCSVVTTITASLCLKDAVGPENSFELDSSRQWLGNYVCLNCCVPLYNVVRWWVLIFVGYLCLHAGTTIQELVDPLGWVLYNTIHGTLYLTSHLSPDFIVLYIHT